MPALGYSGFPWAAHSKLTATLACPLSRVVHCPSWLFLDDLLTKRGLCRGWVVNGYHGVKLIV